MVFERRRVAASIGSILVAGRNGGKVWRLLADYQHRNRAPRHVFGEGKLPRTPIAPVDLGDCWMRLLNLDFTGPNARLQVRTCSTHFKAFASDLPEYARWYKSVEHPNLSDCNFLPEEKFMIDVDDLHLRFGPPRQWGSAGGREKKVYR